MSSWAINLLVGSLGLGVTAVIALGLLRVLRRQPLVSYRLAVAALIATLFLPFAQLLAQRSGALRSSALAAQLAGLRAPLGEADPSEPPSAERTFVTAMARVITRGQALEGQAPLTSDDVVRLELLLDQDGEAADHATLLFQPAELEPAPAPERAESPHGLAATGLGAALESIGTRRLFLGLAAVYLVGLLWSGLRTGLRVVRARALVRHAEPVADAEVLALWERVLRDSPLRDRAKLLTTPEISVPMCFGLTRPVVLLPASPASRGPVLAPEVLSCVLLHELVHLERRDTWIMLAQELMRSVFWFHPAAWWLCRRIDALREISCDLLVVRRTGRRKRYASALVEYADWMRRGLDTSTSTPYTALVPWTSSSSQLSRRIEMLVALSSNCARRSRRATTLAAGSVLAALWGGQLAFAAAVLPAEEAVEVVEASAVQDDDECEQCREARRSRESKVRVERIELPELHTLRELEVPKIEKRSLDKLRATLRLLKDDDAIAITSPEIVVDLEEAPMIGVHVTPDVKLDAKRIVIEKVLPGSLGERAGLKDDDVIVHIDGKDASWDELSRAKRRLARTKVELEVLRDDHDEPFIVELEGDGPHVLKLDGAKRLLHTAKGLTLKENDSLRSVRELLRDDNEGVFELRVTDDEPLAEEILLRAKGLVDQGDVLVLEDGELKRVEQFEEQRSTSDRISALRALLRAREKELQELRRKIDALDRKRGHQNDAHDHGHDHDRGATLRPSEPVEPRLPEPALRTVPADVRIARIRPALPAGAPLASAPAVLALPEAAPEPSILIVPVEPAPLVVPGGPEAVWVPAEPTPAPSRAAVPLMVVPDAMPEPARVRRPEPIAYPRSID